MTLEATSQWRQDPLTGRWVVIAPDRAGRPRPSLPHGHPHDAAATCPFCHLMADPDAEAIERLVGPDGPVIVLPNRYPCVQAVPGTFAAVSQGPYQDAHGLGAHEVIIESPHHEHDLVDMDPGQLTRVIQSWQQRIIDLQRDVRLRSFFLFRNRGHGAGATLTHPHSQLIATPIVPQEIVAELQRAFEYHRRNGGSVVGDVVAHEMSEGHRVVRRTEHFLTVCAYAPRVDFETWIVSTTGGFFWELNSDHVGRLADHLRDVLIRLKASLPKLDYNLVLKTAPNLHATSLPELPTLTDLHRWWSWRLEILPRLHHVAGFEWGSGSFVVTVAPEQAAQHLKRLDLRQP